jgi:Ulp1 family protease
MNSNDVVAAGGTLGHTTLLVKDIRRLIEPDGWINDEIINSWSEFLDSTASSSRRWLNPNTFLWPKLADRSVTVHDWFKVTSY